MTIGRLELGPWQRLGGGTRSVRHWFIGGTAVMQAGHVRFHGPAGFIWFSHGFLGEGRSLEDAESFVDGILRAVRDGVKIPCAEDLAPAPTPSGPRLVP